MKIKKWVAPYPLVSIADGLAVDATIADLAVAVDAGQIRTGGVYQDERTAKYN